MYVRSKKNKSGSVSIQIIEKKVGKYKVVETVGLAKSPEAEKRLRQEAQNRLKILEPQSEIPLLTEDDSLILDFLTKGETPLVRNVGSELILGKIFDDIGSENSLD